MTVTCEDKAPVESRQAASACRPGMIPPTEGNEAGCLTFLMTSSLICVAALVNWLTRTTLMLILIITVVIRTWQWAQDPHPNPGTAVPHRPISCSTTSAWNSAAPAS